MNRLIKTTLLATLACGVAGASFAAEMHAARPTAAAIHNHDDDSDDQAQSTGATLQLAAFTKQQTHETDQIIKHWKSGALSVVPITTLAKGDLQTALSTRKTDEPKQVAHLQKAVESNAAIMLKLKEQNVAPASVVGADRNADGSLKIYVQ